MSGLGNAGRGDLQWLTLAVAIGCLLTLNVVLFVLPGATYTAKVPHDLFGYFDAMHRARHGQSPHADFHTPIGWLSYGLPYFPFFGVEGQVTGKSQGQSGGSGLPGLAAQQAPVVVFRGQ